MKNMMVFEEVAKQRINEKGGDIEKTLDVIRGLIFARVDNARVYAYAKTGQWSKARATHEFFDAIREYYTVIKGH